MLGKLIKHEFRATARTMLPMLGAVAALSVLAMVAFAVQRRVESTIFELLSALVIFAFFLGLLAVCVMAVVVMVNRFYRNLLGDEGYLMMTLPTDVHALLWSKLIVSLVWFAVTALVVMLAGMLSIFCFGEFSLAEFFRGFPSFAELCEAMREYSVSAWNIAAFALEGLALIAVAGFCACLQFYAAMALGHSFNNHRILLSVVFFILLNFVFEVFGIVLLFVPGNWIVQYEPDTLQSFLRLAHLTLLGLLGIGTLYGAMLYLLSVFGLKRHLNLA